MFNLYLSCVFQLSSCTRSSEKRKRKALVVSTVISSSPSLKLLPKISKSSYQTNFCSRHPTEDKRICIRIKSNNYFFPRQTVGLYCGYLQSGMISQITGAYVYLWLSAKRNLTDIHSRLRLGERTFYFD